jgi:hypothetical protein
VVPPETSGADAVMYVAPTELLLAALKVTVALPLLSVNAVVELNTTSPLVDAAKLTTAPFTGVPLALMSIAVAVTGVTVMLEGTLKVRELRLAVPLTVIATGALVIIVVVPPEVSGADAVIYVAPAEELLAAFNSTEAVPLASVFAVVGVGVASVVSDAVKVTTAPGTNAPVVSLSIAVIVTGVPYVTLEGTLKVRELRSVVVVPVPVLVPVVSSLLPPQATRKQNRGKNISSNNGRENLALIDFIILISFL